MKTKKFKMVVAAVLVSAVVLSFCGCAELDSVIDALRGNLVGNNFDVLVYDNLGNEILNVDGQKVGVSAKQISEIGYDSAGYRIMNYKLSSVITSTIDGNDFSQVGNTVLYVEEGLEEICDFTMPEEIQTSGGTINLLDRNINKIKNSIGTPKTVVISSQMGVPIAVYGGTEVYYEIPNDLPKMTRLSIDGKALYIHRANYMILDTNMIK